MPTKAEIVRDLFTGRQSLDDLAPDDVEFAPAGTRGAPADRELLETVEALRAAHAARPGDVRDMFEAIHGAAMTDEDVSGLLEMAYRAADDPSGFFDLIAAPPSTTTVRGPRDWIHALRGWFHAPKAPSTSEKEALARLGQQHGRSAELVEQIRPAARKFEGLDPGWVKCWQGGASQWGFAQDRLGGLWWPDRDSFRVHTGADSGFVYSGLRAGSRDPRVALVADFGTGEYQSLGIAEQLASFNGDIFHLGDVYYNGTEEEYESNFTSVLRPALVNARLFNLAENHDLFSGGEPYLSFLAEHTIQEGSYFCVRYPRHQIIGLDVNWEKRKRLVRDSPQRDWLHDLLSNSGGRTTILLTGPAPYVIGERDPTSLFFDLEGIRDHIHLWFWGDNHYCALFGKHGERVPFYGSCIGHGGYPFGRQKPGRSTFELEELWLETEPRFPEWTGLRQNLGNQGWCELTLLADGGVELCYVDWLGARRARVLFERSASAEGSDLSLVTSVSGERVTTFPRPREDASYDDLRASGVLRIR